MEALELNIISPISLKLGNHTANVKTSTAVTSAVITYLTSPNICFKVSITITFSP